MDDETPLHTTQLEVNGELFGIKVYCSSAGRYFAKTCLGEGDVIITDGPTVSDALRKHSDLLPLAVGTRVITQSYLGTTRRSKARRF